MPSKTESMPKLKLVSLSFHMFTYFLNVCLNTEDFSLHHTESEGREIWCYVAGGEMLGRTPGHIRRPNSLEGVLS